MLHLLLLEWKKISANRTFVVMSILYFVFLPASYLTWKIFRPEVTGNMGHMDEIAKQILGQDPYMFPFTWQSFGYLGSWFNFYALGIIGIMIITMEYNYRTMRQSIINGLTRTEFFISKILMVLAISIVFSLYFCITGFIIGYFSTDVVYSSKVFQNIHIIPLYSLQILGYMSVAVLIGWIFKRFALSIIVYFVYPMFEGIVKWVGMTWIAKTKAWNFLPINVMEDLVPVFLPIGAMNVGIYEASKNVEKEFGFTLFLSSGEAALASIVFIVLFLFLSYRLFIKTDL